MSTARARWRRADDRGDGGRQHGTRVDRCTSLLVYVAPLAGYREVLECEAERIDYAVTLVATRFLPVLFEARAYCRRFFARSDR